MRVLGIDPGKSGALAVIEGRLIVDVIDMPVVGKKNDISPALILDWLQGIDDIDLAVIEFVRSSPQMGVASAFSFGRGLGVVETAVAALRIPVEDPTPAKWKKDFALSKDKGESRALAIDIWPSEAQRFARVKDDGRAEACLLAEWGQRRLASRTIQKEAA